METIHANWYDYPHLYDLAFGWDAGVEVSFLEEGFRRHAAIPVKRVFEPFVGTGRIAIELARRGYQVTGLDINSKALEFARQRCDQAGVRVDLQRGDVHDWSPSEPVDAIVTLIDSFRYLTGADDAADAVRAFHRGIQPGGVLIVGLDVGAKPVELTQEERWTMERDGTTIETVVFDMRKPGTAPGTSVARSVLHVTESDGREYEIITDDEFRLYTRESFLQLLRDNGPFQPCAICDRGYDFDKPVRPENAANDIVAVFRRA